MPVIRSVRLVARVELFNEADAHAALDAFRARGIDGAVGLVQTYCMD